MGDRSTLSAMRFTAILFLAAAAAAQPALARDVAIDAPAGRMGESAATVARQAGTSIVVADPVLANRRVPPVRGRLSVETAVRRLARAAGGRAVKVGTNAWRIEPGQAAVSPASRASAGTAAVSPGASPKPPPEDIVVIGSKRDAALADYPGQVTIVRGDSLAFGGAGGTEKLAQRVPTLTSTHLGSGRNKLFIRGIADSSFTGPTQSTVGQYFGDLRLSYNAPDPDLRLSDLDRVEVLEGPQGTLYGAGSLGGIVRIVPNAPEAGHTEASAMLGGSATRHGGFGGDASAMLNLPLAEDSVALRVNLDAESQAGYIDKPLLGREDVNRTDILGGRAALRVEAGGGWTVDLIGIGQTTRGADSQYADRGGPPLTRAARVEEGFAADYLQGQLVVAGEIGTVRFRSSTGLARQELEERYDATLEDGPERIFVQANDTEMIANETRLWQPLEGQFGWLVGTSYVKNSTTLTRTLGLPDLLSAATGVENKVEEITLYGEASLRLAEGLVANAGGRLTYSWLGGDGEDIAMASLTEADVRQLAEATASRRESVFLPSVSLVASPFEETSLFFRYQEGFRPGGLAVSGELVSRFRNDHIATMEFGGRHGVPGRGPFDIAASVSFTRWQDIQADFIDGSGLPSTANIGNGRIWSASVTGGIAVTEGLRLAAGATFNDSRVDEPDLFLLASGRVSQVPNIAEFAGRLGVEYSREIGRNLVLTAEGWAHYVGKSRLGVGPELGELQGDYLDTGLIARIGDEALGVTFSVTNLADVTGNRFALGTPFAIGRDQITPLQPRTVRIGIDATF